MGRPARAATERVLVAQALAEMPADLSQRRKCALLAVRVVDELLAASLRADPFELALVALQRGLQAVPAVELAADPDIALASELARERLQRFEARGCRQVSREDWDRETAEIRTKLIARLTDRFRRAR